MITTDKECCRMLADALMSYGIERVVASPGSRNMPLIVAFSRCNGLQVETVVDERSAAFIALGMAEVSDRPVALCCTSGTALLNYAPAIAEAYYKKLPLVVISADRPKEWIDQDDSQTMRQDGVFANYSLGSFSVTAQFSDDIVRQYSNRLINEALVAATTGRKGPVHLNVHISEPLDGMMKTQSPSSFRKIKLLLPDTILDQSTNQALVAELVGKRVMIVGGFHSPSDILSASVSTLASRPNVIVFAEGLANIHSSGGIVTPERLLIAASDDELSSLRPDVVISFGGALVSRRLKEQLRRWHPDEHWHVGQNSMTIDCFNALTRRIEISADRFFQSLSDLMPRNSVETKKADTYRDRWQIIAKRGDDRVADFLTTASWSDILAISRIIPQIPSDWNLQLSNGMTVRYAQLFSLNAVNRVDCNRGVSGIDGSVSTALGASVASDHTTLLLTGDMSMQYDISALSSVLLSPRLKIVVFNNGGGGIFHVIKSTRDLPELKDRFACHLNLPLEQLATSYGLKYFRLTCVDGFDEVFNAFKQETESPCLLEIVTDSAVGAAEMRRFSIR